MESKKLIAAIIFAFAILVAVILITADRPAASYENFIADLGWQVDEATVNVSDIVIPEYWDDTMEEYNELQKESGYDLTEYKGQTAKLYSYAVLNLDGYDNVYINLIIQNGKIIGGDISSVAIDGFMLPLRKRVQNGTT